MRKGQRYGTILCDLETGKPIDLLPDRSAETLAVWLQAHPEIEIISRDRGGIYAEGARLGAPQAQQVADRFHLLKNLGEALQRLLDRHVADLKAVAQEEEKREVTQTPQTRPLTVEAGIAAQPRTPLFTPPEPEQTLPSSRRTRYEEVRVLVRQGLSERAIARQTGLSRVTVRRYARADTFPERAAPPARTVVEAFAAIVEQRLAEGGHSVQAIFEDLRTQGYSGSYSRVYAYVRRIYPQGLRARQVARVPQKRVRLSARSATWLFLRKSCDLSEEEQARAMRICQQSTEIDQANTLFQRFARMLRHRQADCLDEWLTEASECGIVEVANFARGVRQDYWAVKAGLSLHWSNGPVEGQINRLKLVKRSMYGRAGFVLLKKRYLHGC